jgi:hypothetical protein
MNSCHVAAAEGGRAAVSDDLAELAAFGRERLHGRPEQRQKLADPAVERALAEQAQRREDGADVLERVAILGEDQHAVTRDLIAPLARHV